MSKIDKDKHETTLPVIPELQKLQVACERITDASISNEEFLDNLIKNVARVSAVMKDGFRFLTTWDYSRPDVLHDIQLYRILSRTPYTELMDVVIYKPVGFNGNLSDYVNHLFNSTLPVIENFIQETLLPAQRQFSYYLNDPESLTERRLNDSFKVKTLGNVETLIGTDFFTAGNRSTEVPFGDVFDNNRQCWETMDFVNKINERRWNKANPKEVSKQVKELVVISTAVFDNINKDPNQVSKEVIVDLANKVDLIAKQVQIFSAVTTKIVDVTTALKLTEKKLLRVL